MLYINEGIPDPHKARFCDCPICLPLVTSYLFSISQLSINSIRFVIRMQHVDSEGLFLFLFMLVIFFPADMKEQFFSLLLYYMLLKRRTDKPKIKTFQIALHAYKRVTQHMGTPLSDMDISFRKSKGFNLRSLTPKISICHGSFLLFMILVCFWPVLKHR